MFNNQPQISQQILELIKTILYQNDFQYDDKYYQPTKGIAMGSPISSTIAEIYLQYFEETILKHWMETKEIIYYKRYVDDIIIIINQDVIKEETVLAHMNNVHKHPEFKMRDGVNNTTNYLDLHIHRNHDSIQLGIYRKPTQTDTTIHYTSTHPLQHKLAAYTFYMNRLLSILIIEQEKQHEWNTICTMAKNNVSPLRLIHILKHKISKTQLTSHKPTSATQKKWIAFTYHSPPTYIKSLIYSETQMCR